MFTDTLFGHSKGAFTGADKNRDGLVFKAKGGTLFLDEIGELSHPSQIKLLRFLQEQKYYPMGSDTLHDSDARIIVSTNKDLHSLAEKGLFRKDLFYRLCTHQIFLPPLRDRIEDVPLLLEHFIEDAAKLLGKQTPVPSSELLILLPQLSYPGNVRELKAMVTDAVARHESGLLTIHHFKGLSGNNKPKPISSKKCDFIGAFHGGFPTLREIEKFMIGKAMEASSGNKSAAANLLGITRQALNKRERSERDC
jgi:DNA-binding NtrC family response regulator